MDTCQRGPCCSSPCTQTQPQQLPRPTAHLWQGALCLPQLDEDPKWDAEHRGQSHEPADAVAPSRICVHVVVLERLVLDQKEDEDALWRGRWRRSLVVPLPYFKGPGTSTVHSGLEAEPWEEVSLTVNTGTVALEPRLLRTLGFLQGCGISPLS